ncbi:MAG: rod shape-determining protein MreD [Tannerellaceae bacterium]|jgi:rod shape-determining protein MreD|nr:rod shape-determining protein MreD [Tannerellaceae bacterium]
MVNTVRGLVYFVILVLVQVLVLNNIHFLRLVTPFLYIYFIIKLPVGYSSVQVTFLSFLLGMAIDILSNTSGMHAAACTLAGFARPYIIWVFMREDLPENIYPSYKTFGYGGFIRFAFVFVLLHHISLFLIESLTLFDPLFLTIRIVAGVAMTTAFICVIEAFNRETRRDED